MKNKNKMKDIYLQQQPKRIECIAEQLGEDNNLLGKLADKQVRAKIKKDFHSVLFYHRIFNRALVLQKVYTDYNFYMTINMFACNANYPSLMKFPDDDYCNFMDDIERAEDNHFHQIDIYT